MKLSAIDLGVRSRWISSVDFGGVILFSCCARKASMKGVRVRMAVNSVRDISFCYLLDKLRDSGEARIQICLLWDA